MVFTTTTAFGASSAFAVHLGTAAATPTISLDLPSSLGNGGDLQGGDATITNNSASDIPGVRVDFEIAPVGSTATLSPADFVVKYYDGANWDTITLTADAAGTGVSGYYGPAGGFTIPANTTATTQLEVASNPQAPTGSVRVTAYVDTTPGDTTTSVTSASTNVALETPAISFSGYPAKLPAGGAYVGFSGSIDNATGSNYGGTNPAAPTPAGVRYDFDISSSTSIKAADVSLQYCDGGTDAACDAGTWDNIPLQDSGNDVTGEFGPQGGFALPAGATNTSYFQIKVAAGTPAGSVQTITLLDKVDSTGSPTGTDSTGVANGTVTSDTETSAVTEPVLTLNLPAKIGNGGDLQAGSVTIDNTGGPEIDGVRTDLQIMPKTSGVTLSPDDFVIELNSKGTLVPVTLTADANNDGGLTGYAPPEAGFTIDPDHSDTTDVMVAANPAAPTGDVTVTASLDTTPGDTTTAISTASSTTTISSPTFSFTDFPSTITAGGGFVTFTGTLDNQTGSNYGGSDPAVAPTPAGLVADISFASNDSALSPSDLLFQACNGGTDANCTGGTWVTETVSGTGTLTSKYGATGFALPNTADESTYFRIALNRAVPNGTTITPTVTLTKVLSDGTTSTGTDSSGVANGPVETTNPGTITVGGFVKPSITAKVTSAHKKSFYGWYRSNVTVKYTCNAGTAGTLTTACPAPTVFKSNGKHTVTKTITASNGATATVTVKNIKLDHTKPHVKVTGVKKGHTYAHQRTLHATCSDSMSGIASCHVSSHKSGHTVHYTAKATDKAGNTATVKGKYKLKK